MINQRTIQKIKDTADIVEVVSDYVHLTRRGANYMGLCPFHNERTPSFSVNKSRNFCYCFSCHKGGGPINFVMEKEGISYHDALLQLAKKYGIKVEERELTDEERESQNLREGMLIANEWAASYFESNLDKEEGRDIGLQYLYHRGVTQEAIKQFHLGYAIDDGSDLLKSALSKGFKTEIFKALGLIGTNQQGKEYDRFRGRVIFPIMNSSGKTIAFGGRDLKGSPAKYINSPESDIYKKSNELYGIYQARNEITRQDRCFLVEGYLDVIGMWQSGIKNVVASSGTALTDGQISLIHRFTNNVTLIYDGDAAGIKASLRGIDMLLSHNLNVKVLLLPDGDDPDSFARKHTPEEFREYIEQKETDIIRFKTEVLMKETLSDPQKRVVAIKSVILSLAHIPDKVKRDVYIQECSKLLNVPEESVSEETARQREIIVRQEKINRSRNQLDRDISSGRIEPSNFNFRNQEISRPDTNGLNSDNEISKEIKNDKTGKENNITDFYNPLRPLEMRILRYCIRYGFLSLINNSNDKEWLSKDVFTIIEYVDEELSIDGIEFTDKDIAFTFDILKNLLPDFKRDLTNFKISLNSNLDIKRKQGYDVIADKGLSFANIEKEELNLEQKLLNERESAIKEYSKNYISNQLGNHENKIVRQLTLESLKEPHQLSNIHFREGNVEKEEDRLDILLINALNVLKNGILDKELNSLLSLLKEKSANRDNEEEKKIHQRIADILQMRSRMAKDIGERIISPRK